MTREEFVQEVVKEVAKTVVRTFAEFQAEADQCLQSIAQEIGHLGKLLLLAKEQLLSTDYDQLEKFLRNRGLTQSDIEAAKAVAKGDLDGRLFFMGVASSKILTLGKDDQERLLIGEEFELLDANLKDTYWLPWNEMCEGQRNQLLGPKGGSIRPAHLQTPYNLEKTPGPLTISEVGYSHRRLNLTAGNKHGDLELGFLIKRLATHGVLEEFLRDVNTLQQLYIPKVA
jgi:hypothetical protein